MEEEVCLIGGLPRDICLCKGFHRYCDRIKIQFEDKGQQGVYKRIVGIEAKEINLLKLALNLKDSLACDMLIEDRTIVLQGKYISTLKNS
ncbi:MAG: hypothetical protein ACFFBD_28815 [Candidatus Hodarchaeota archaeon]